MASIVNFLPNNLPNSSTYSLWTFQQPKTWRRVMVQLLVVLAGSLLDAAEKWHPSNDYRRGFS
jgi:hypothetical protein